MRLIDADALKKTLDGTGNLYHILHMLVDQEPTIDHVHAMGGCYCGECKHHKPIDYCILHHATGWFDDKYCSFGEPRKADYNE